VVHFQWIKASKPCFKVRELKHQFQMGKAMPARQDYKTSSN